MSGNETSYSSIMKDIDSLQNVERELYNRLDDIGESQPKPITCPDGFNGPNKNGYCTASWKSTCGEECHKKKCTDVSGNFLDLDFTTKPYTCKPYEETNEREQRANLEKKKDVMKKINEVSKIRISLYKTLSDLLKQSGNSFIQNSYYYKTKLDLLKKTEQEMNTIKQQINSKRGIMQEKAHIINLNKKMLHEEILNKKIVKIIFLMCLYVVALMLLSNVAPVLNPLIGILVVSGLAYGIYKIGNMKYYQFAEKQLRDKNYFTLTEDDVESQNIGSMNDGSPMGETAQASGNCSAGGNGSNSEEMLEKFNKGLNGETVVSFDSYE